MRYHGTRAVFVPGLCCGAALLALCGCMREKEARVREKLVVIADAELEELVCDSTLNRVSDSARYRITEFREFKKGKLSYRAQVDYYIFNDVNIVVRRKYSYHRWSGKWERFYNKYHFVHDSSGTMR